jgi:pimeloyl-ACP methyl ester carboxylesterase
MFEGFTLRRVDVGEAQLRVRYGGAGPAVLLLHGHPRTHVTWHKVAPLLAERLRGGDVPRRCRLLADAYGLSAATGSA